MENIPNNGSGAEAYRQRLFELSHGIDDKDIVSYFDDLNTKVTEWKKEYGENIKKYELYHILIGSTPMEGQTFISFDLPGGAITQFISELENKYKK